MSEQAEPSQLASRLEHEQLRRLEVLSILEATTLVLLVCVALPLKHGFGWPLGTRVLGPVHGVAFLAYTWAALQTVAGGGWRGSDKLRLFAVALVPFAGYFNLPWLQRRAETFKEGDAE